MKPSASWSPWQSMTQPLQLMACQLARRHNFGEPAGRTSACSRWPCTSFTDPWHGAAALTGLQDLSIQHHTSLITELKHAVSVFPQKLKVPTCPDTWRWAAALEGLQDLSIQAPIQDASACARELNRLGPQLTRLSLDRLSCTPGPAFNLPALQVLALNFRP